MENQLYEIDLENIEKSDEYYFEEEENFLDKIREKIFFILEHLKKNKKQKLCDL
jgi:hypothetical protein